jgi:hypothetical protein
LMFPPTSQSSSQLLNAGLISMILNGWSKSLDKGTFEVSFQRLFQYWMPSCYAYASNPTWSDDWSFHDSQAFEALTSGKWCICCNFRMNKVLLKYLMPHLNPVEDVSDGKI